MLGASVTHIVSLPTLLTLALSYEASAPLSPNLRGVTCCPQDSFTGPPIILDTLSNSHNFRES